jgi:polyphosphate kinase 2 (PPK2 family)
MKSKPCLGDIDLSLKMKDKDDYEATLGKLQAEIAELAVATYHNGGRVVIVLEGWDAAGKGGAIRRMVEKIDPRSCRVHAIGKPDQRELGQHYLQRFWERLPPRGHIAIFDRSWYGRVLVERVEELASGDEWQRAYGEINGFEKALSDDGVVLSKLFLHISQEEQLKRYQERLENPRKHWKLTPDDLRNRARAKDYFAAYDDMFSHTHCPQAPWHLIAGEHKWYARTQVLAAVCNDIRRAIDTAIPRFSAREIAETKRALGI